MINDIAKKLNEMGYKTEIITVSKNGVEKQAITIGEGLLRPTFYPDSSKSVEDWVKEILRAYKAHPGVNINVGKITSWEYAKDNLELCLQRKTTEKILKRNYLDMEMYVRVRVAQNNDEVSTYIVNPGMFKNVSEDEIFARAFLNMKKNVFVEKMENFLPDILKNNFDGLPEMIILTNKNKIYGASSICDKELLSKISKEYNSDLIILPSSIHECIIYIDYISNAPNLDKYSEMVSDINKTEVAPEEVLSDHAYRFDKETHEITY